MANAPSDAAEVARLFSATAGGLKAPSSKWARASTSLAN